MAEMLVHPYPNVPLPLKDSGDGSVRIENDVGFVIVGIANARAYPMAELEAFVRSRKNWMQRILSVTSAKDYSSILRRTINLKIGWRYCLEMSDYSQTILWVNGKQRASALCIQIRVGSPFLKSKISDGKSVQIKGNSMAHCDRCIALDFLLVERKVSGTGGCDFKFNLIGVLFEKRIH